MHVRITSKSDGDNETSLLADVDGTKLPLVTYTAEPCEDGRTLVSLVVAADEVSVSRFPASEPASGVNPPLRVWGDRDLPDPRESIPGWQPERLGAQVARNAEVSS